MHSHCSIQKFVYYQVVSHHNSYAKEINKHIHSFIHSFKICFPKYFDILLFFYTVTSCCSKRKIFIRQVSAVVLCLSLSVYPFLSFIFFQSLSPSLSLSLSLCCCFFCFLIFWNVIFQLS